MNRYLLPLESVSSADGNLVGAKAAALGELLAAGFPVPPGRTGSTLSSTGTIPTTRPAPRQLPLASTSSWSISNHRPRS